MSGSGVPTLPPALEGIVEENAASAAGAATNYLTFNRVYSKIGSTSILSSDPGVVHIGGFQLGQTYQTTLKIRNISSAGTRIHIIPPTTPFFKAHCNNKKGLVAPGLNEEIEIEFTPQDYRYYYDCVRIHSEEENLLVPIHAYPIMNETKFPKRIDFGKAAVGDTVVKKVKMECKVPIEFEFEIRQLKANPAFKVEPTRGVVPAHGHVVITVTFTPFSLTTEETRLEVRVAEFNSEPVICTVTGSALPGLAKERVIAEATGLRQATIEQLDGTQMMKTAARTFLSKGGGHAHGGSGGGDAYTAFIMEQRKHTASLRDCRKTGPIQSKPPKLPPPPSEAVVDGIYLPDGALRTTADMAYVLNQEPGKLRIKDVKDAIATKKRELAAHQAALDQILSEGLDQGVHPLERPEVPPHIKAALFHMLMTQAEENERRVALGSGVHVGDDIIPADDITEAQRLREDQHKQHQLNTELAATRRLDAELEPTGALHLPTTSGSDAADSSSSLTSGYTTRLPPGYQPAWRLIEGNDLKKRADNLLRFQRAVWRVIYTARLLKALKKIKNVLSQLGWDKQRLAEESANPVLLVREDDRPGTAPTKHLKPENVRTRPLPLYRDVNFTYHEAVATSHYTDFDELGPMQARVPLEYKVLGYSAEDFPGLTTYTPPLLEQPLEEGAPEESVGVLPSGVIPDLSQLPPMPDCFKQPPFTVLEIGNRYSEDKVFALPEPSWGMDDAYLVQPQVYAFHDSTRQEAVASGSLRALRGAPTLSEKWLPRKDTWQVQLSDEVVPPLLSGPDPADLLRDSPEDADKPPIRIAVPTDEEIAQYLPQGMANVLEIRPGSTGSGQAGAGAGAESSSTQNKPFELMRQRRQAELDAAKRAARAESIGQLDSRIQQYNATLHTPCHFAIKL